MLRSPQPFDFDSCRELFSCDLTQTLKVECIHNDDRCFDCPSCSYFMQCGACLGRDICTMSPYFYGNDVGDIHG